MSIRDSSISCYLVADTLYSTQRYSVFLQHGELFREESKGGNGHKEGSWKITDMEVKIGKTWKSSDKYNLYWTVNRTEQLSARLLNHPDRFSFWISKGSHVLYLKSSLVYVIFAQNNFSPFYNWCFYSVRFPVDYVPKQQQPRLDWSEPTLLAAWN